MEGDGEAECIIAVTKFEKVGFWKKEDEEKRREWLWYSNFQSSYFAVGKKYLTLGLPLKPWSPPYFLCKKGFFNKIYIFALLNFDKYIIFSILYKI